MNFAQANLKSATDSTEQRKEIEVIETKRTAALPNPPNNQKQSDPVLPNLNSVRTPRLKSEVDNNQTHSITENTKESAAFAVPIFPDNPISNPLDDNYTLNVEHDHEMQESSTLNSFQALSTDNDEYMAMLAPSNIVINRGSSMTADEMVLIEDLRRLPKEKAKQLIASLNKTEEMDTNE